MSDSSSNPTHQPVPNQSPNPVDPQPPRPLGFNDVEAARILGMKPSTLRRWRSQGIGPVYRKIGRNVQYTQADLQKYHDQQAVGR